MAESSLLLPISCIEQLKGDNYCTWSMKVSAVLRSRKLFSEIIEGPDYGTDFEKNEDRAKFETKNEEALSLIVMTLSAQIAPLFINERSAKRLWNELKRLYCGSDEDMKIHLNIELRCLQMKPDETINDYIVRARTISSKSASLGMQISERELVFHIIRGLSPKFEELATSLRTHRNLSLEELTEILLEEEMRVSVDKKRYNRHNIEERAYRARGPNGNRGNERWAEIRCYACGGRGHIARECRNSQRMTSENSQREFRRQPERSEPFTDRVRSNTRAKESTSKQRAFSTVESTVSSTQPYEMQSAINLWSIDSGSTSHMSPHLECMENVVPCEIVIDLAENSRSIEAVAKGDINVITKLNDGTERDIKIKDVLYAPNLRENLLSVRSLTEKGNIVVFESDKAQILDEEGNCWAECIVKDSMYLLEMIPIKDRHETTKCMEARSPGSTDTGTRPPDKNSKELWHRRLGHINENYLDKLKNDEMVFGLEYKAEKLGLCENCVLGKLSEDPHRPSSSMPSKPLELLHIDLCGPMPTPTLGGAKYIFVIVDGYSSYVHVILLKSKAETFDKFEEFLTKVENEQNARVKRVRSDNGSEFVNHKFKNLFAEKGIHHELTTTYSPASNGNAERMNRSLLDKTRTMLIESKLPTEFWGEAIKCAAYLKNRSPTQNGGDKTPFEKWYGRKPNVSFLKVFGCMGYYYVPKQLREKLEPKSERGIFVGYAENRSAYRIYNPEDGSIHETRTAKFNENLMAFPTVNKTIFSNTDVSNDLTYMRDAADEELMLNQDYLEKRNFDESTSETEERSNELPSQDGHETIQVEEEVHTTETQAQQNKRGRRAGDTEAVIRVRRRQELDEREEQLRVTGVRRSQRLEDKRNQTSALAIQGISVPKSYSEAVNSPYKEKWIQAMNEEMNSLRERKVWKLVDRREGDKVIPSKWVYAIKQSDTNSEPKFKARLVAMGMNQKEGIDYDESFAPVIALESFRIMIALALNLGMTIGFFDVKSAYLYGDLEEKVLMAQPTGYACGEDEGKVCELLKSIYGLPQSGHRWNVKLNEILRDLGMVRLSSEPCMYRMDSPGGLLLLGVYVDDIMVMSTSEKEISNFIQRLGERVEIREIKNNQFLGMCLTKTDGGYQLSQANYIDKVLKKFNMQDCNGVTCPCDVSEKLDNYTDSPTTCREDYQALVGSLLYIARCTRPDIMYIVNYLSRFNQDPRELHLRAAKRVLRYLKATREYALHFGKSGNSIIAYTDAGWCSDGEAKSVSGCTVKIGNNLVSWRSQKQRLVSLSTCEAEIIAFSEGLKDILWIRDILEELDLLESTIVRIDSKATYDWLHRDKSSARTRHLNRRYQFCRDETQNNERVKIELVRSQEMEADMLTKAVGPTQMKNNSELIGLRK